MAVMGGSSGHRKELPGVADMCLIPGLDLQKRTDFSVKAELEQSGLPCQGRGSGDGHSTLNQRLLGPLIPGEAWDPIRQPVQRGTDSCQFKLEYQRFSGGGGWGWAHVVSVWLELRRKLDDRFWTAHVWTHIDQGRGCFGRMGYPPFVEIWESWFLDIIDTWVPPLLGKGEPNQAASPNEDSHHLKL